MENVENLIIEHLKALRGEIQELKVDVREIKTRVAHLEAGLGQVTQHIGHVASMLAAQQSSHDRVVDRIERIEKRLEITAS